MRRNELDKLGRLEKTIKYDYICHVFICHIMSGLGNRLKLARTTRKITMKDLAQQTGIDQALISKYEGGKRYPSEEHMGAIAIQFAKDRKELMTAWLAEKVCNVVKKYPDLISEVMIAAEERAIYLTKQQALEAPVLTPSLEEQLSRIDSLHHKWNNKRPFDGTALKKMREHFHISYTYESNKIEGNTLTLQDTYFVVSEGMTISGKSLNEHLEAINHADAIGFVESIMDKNEDLTSRSLNEIHSLVLRGIDADNAGRYRSLPVRISGSTHVPPQPYLLDKYMEDYFKFYKRQKDLMHPVILAAEMHERLVTIHPYIDGNGRTSRLVMNLILLRHGYTIANLKGDNESRMRYYRSLNAVQEEHDSTEFYHLILDAVEQSLMEHLDMVT